MKKLEQPAAVIFDMDGLIFDTEVLYSEAFLLEISERGHGHLRPEHARAMVGLPWEAVRSALLALLSTAKQADDLIEGWKRRYVSLSEDRLETKPGVLELLDTLHRRAIPHAICTSTNRQTAESHLGRHALLQRFNAIITGDDCDNGKPHPEPYLRAAAALGVEAKDCWALEDSPNGIRSAHAAGMTAIMIPDMVQPGDDITACCARICGSLHDIAGLIENGGLD